jgi:hypothetical protein
VEKVTYWLILLSRRPCGGCKQCFSDASSCARIPQVRDGGDVRSCTLSAAQPPMSIADVSCDEFRTVGKLIYESPPTAQVTEERCATERGTSFSQVGTEEATWERSTKTNGGRCV